MTLENLSKEPVDAVEYGTLDADLQRCIEAKAADEKAKADKAAVAAKAASAGCKQD